jgi:ubiquinone/menaquinone biosynthesis C-methylase UbiE
MPDELFWEIHSGLPREGAGDNESTRRAFLMMSGLPQDVEILDVASGPGMQTMELARISSGRITAVDTYQPFLDELLRRAQANGVADRVTTINASMFSMPFGEQRFDVIWCEGALYMMGLRRALTDWCRFLKPDGFIAFSEPCFLTEHLPEKVKKHWVDDYPAMTNIENSLRMINEAGYLTIGHFTIPDWAWWQDYYTPLEKRLQQLREKYAFNPAALERLEQTQEEVNTHRIYANYYGYVFFVVRKIERV